MRKFFVNQELKDNIVFDEDYNHIVNVLRMKEGDNINLFNGDGYNYHYCIDKINKKNIEARLIEKNDNFKENCVEVSLFQAFIKPDNMELIAQKLTELNVDNLYFFSSDYTNLKCKETIIDKLKRVSAEACKQCERSRLLNISSVGKFDNMLSVLSNFDAIIFAYEKSNKNFKTAIENLKAKKVAVIVGPEGGFSEAEKESLLKLKNVLEVSISRNILKAETASIMLASVLMYELN